MSNRIAVVDDENLFCRWTSRAEVHEKRLPHRSVQVLLLDSEGRLVLQQRHRSKDTYPGCWDLSASGHVEEQDYPNAARPDQNLEEVYDAVAHRELSEELGVVAHLTRVAYFPPEPDVHYEHMVLYRGFHDGPFRAQVGEVAKIRAFAPHELTAFLAGSAARTRSLEWLVRWARKHRLASL